MSDKTPKQKHVTAKPKPKPSTKPKYPSRKKNTQPRKVARSASGKRSRAKRQTGGPSAAPATPHEVGSTPSTPSTEIRLVEGVEGVEGQPTKPTYDWCKDKPLHENFRKVGAGMRRLVPDLYHHPDGGLVLVEGGRPRRIKSAKELSPLLIDNIHIRVWKEEGGKRANKYVVLLNTNEGVMSADFLNRALPIGLNSTGDMEERLAWRPSLCPPATVDAPSGQTGPQAGSDCGPLRRAIFVSFLSSALSAPAKG
jgi:hypothetical protein